MFKALREAIEGLRMLGKGYGGGGSASGLIGAWQTAADSYLSRTGDVLYPVAQHPTIHRAIKAISSSLAQVTVEVFADDDPDTPAEPDHWLPALLQRPTPATYGDSFQELVSMFLESRGEAFIWHQQIRRDAGGGFQYPHELWFLWPECMTPLPAGAQRLEEVTGWQYMGPEGTKKIPNEELTVFRFPNPHDPIRGLSPLGALIVEYTGDYKMAVYNRAFYDNSAVPSIIFTSKANWPETDRRAFIQAWNLLVRGAHKSGLATALPKDVEATIVKLTQQEMSFLDSRRFSREQILSVYGVPPAVAGVFEYANYANSEQQERFFLTKTILPKLRYNESVYTEGLVRRYQPGYRVRYKTQPLIAELAAKDYAAKVETGTKLMSMGFPPADVNDKLELGMDTNGKPWLEEGYLPFSMVPASTILEGPNDGVQEPGGGESVPPAPQQETGGRFLPAPGPGLLLPAKRKAASEQDRANRWSGLAQQWGGIGRAYHRRVRSWLWELRSETLSHLPSKAQRKAEDPEDAVGLLFDAEDANAELVAISKPTWEQAAKAGASALEDETGLGITFSLQDPRVQAFFADKAVKIKRVTANVRAHIQQTIAEGIRNGESSDQIAARIRQGFDIERSKSITIARTETAQAFGGGRYNAMLQTGIVFQEWITSRDTRVRESHADIDGEVVGVGERFSNGCLYPGDPSGPLEEIINCRCANGAQAVASDE
jgi:HK97 family phage portal protein